MQNKFKIKSNYLQASKKKLLLSKILLHTLPQSRGKHILKKATFYDKWHRSRQHLQLSHCKNVTFSPFFPAKKFFLLFPLWVVSKKKIYWTSATSAYYCEKTQNWHQDTHKHEINQIIPNSNLWSKSHFSGFCNKSKHEYVLQLKTLKNYRSNFRPKTSGNWRENKA